MVVEGPLDVLDHSAPQPLWGAKIGIDATRKGPDEGHSREWPPDVQMSPEVKARVDEIWPALKLDRWLGTPRGESSGRLAAGDSPTGDGEAPGPAGTLRG